MNPQAEAIATTYNNISAFKYEPAPFYYVSSPTNPKEAIKAIVHKVPQDYLDYQILPPKERRKMYSDLMNDNFKFKLYVEAVDRRNIENESNKAHIQNMVAGCNELGDSFDKYKQEFIKVLERYV